MFLDSIFTEEGTLRIRYYISENEVEDFRTNMEIASKDFSTAKLFLERIEEYESSEEDLSEGFTFKGVRTYIEGMEEIRDVFDEHIGAISVYRGLKNVIKELGEAMDRQQELIERQDKTIKNGVKDQEVIEISKMMDGLVGVMKITISSIREKLLTGDYLGAMGTADSFYERLKALENKSLKDIDTSLIS